MASSPLRPKEPRPPVPDGGAGVSQSYFRTESVKASKSKWSPGDVVYWRGQSCKIVRAIPEDKPLCVVLRTPRGSEVTTDTSLISEASAETSGFAPGPLRLAPLTDLFLERPPKLPSFASPRGAASYGALPGSRGATPPPVRPSSREPRRSSGRTSSGSPMQIAGR
ncbi:unnamed protein product [Polarella glacialis]|uniref:Uncharacterized protein n=1 Tax=Polarella glacialis TaxID=89957 RepID=A0A813JDZ9_POLGL|nr:unnamed protein product [Polarella glacialis]